MENNAQLDNELLNGYIDNLGKAIVQQMLELYIQQSVVYLSDINKAVNEQSQTLWKEHSHKMKGAAGSVGLTAVHAKLVILEKLEEQWTEKKRYSEELAQLNKTAIECFSRWLEDK